MKWNRVSISVAITLFALLLFVPFLGASHLFDWDEINFAEAAREMLLTGEYSYVQINFKPFWEKPPLFIWMQALSMKAFGVNEFAARFPNAICGALTLTVLFNIGARLISRNFGLLWALVFAGSILPQFYFRSGIIDPWFNLFIFLGVYQLIRATEQTVINRKHLVTSALFVGLAVLTKGPTGFALVALCAGIYFLFNFKTHKWKISDGLIFLAVSLFVGFSWFLIEILRGRGYIVQEFIDYHIRLLTKSEAGHGQPFYYHPIVLLLGCFPMSLFFIFGWMNRTDPESSVIHYRKWMNILFWVVLIVFSIVKTKIIHYSSLTYFPMSFLAALSIKHLVDLKWKFRIGHHMAMLFFIVVFGAAFVLLGILDTIKEPLLQLLKNNQLAHANFSQQIADGTFDPFIGILFLLGALTSVYLLYSKRIQWGIVGLFGTTLISVSLLSILIGPKIDAYTQTSLFEFYEENAEEAYLEPLSFHSYAHLFYGNRSPISAKPKDELAWLSRDSVDRPVYFISRLQDVDKAFHYFPNLRKVDQKGGYVILERTDKNYPFLGEE